MGLIKFLKNIFRKEELSEEELKKINPDYKKDNEQVDQKLLDEFEFKDPELTIKTEEKATEYSNFKEFKEPEEDIKIEDEVIEEQKIEENIKPPELTVEQISLLGNIDIEDLALDKLESESETVNTYLKMLMKDISAYQDNKNDKQKQEVYVKAISTKVKKITLHSLEIKNLLGMIETHYFEVLINNLKKINDKRFDNNISLLEKDLELVKKLETQLTKVIAYDDLLNPEKNKNFSMAIESEVSKGKIHHDVSELYSILSQSLSKTLGIKAKIKNNNLINLHKVI